MTKTYKYKRSLTRHIRERHIAIEHWKCLIPTCTVKFIRRNYLCRHLIYRHGLSPVDARIRALSAPRGDKCQRGYYETISDDESAFDLIAELEELRRSVDVHPNAFDVDEFLSDDGAGANLYSDVTTCSPEASIDDVAADDVPDVAVDDLPDVAVDDAADATDAFYDDTSDAVSEDASDTDNDSLYTDVDDDTVITIEDDCESSDYSEISETPHVMPADNDGDNEAICMDSSVRIVQYVTIHIEKTFTYRGEDLVHEQIQQFVDQGYYTQN